MSRLLIRNLVVEYGAQQVLRNVTLDVPQGSLVALVGPSGCGKTTLVRTVAGLARSTFGDIRLGERTVAAPGIHVAPEKRRIGWVPQDAALFPHLTVAQNIAFGLGPDAALTSPALFRRRAAQRAAHNDRVRQLLELVSLSEFAERLPAALSGGQSQRVALARALASAPDVVLLDEPFGALDPLLRAELRAEVRELLRIEQTTALLVTHDQAEALSVADYVAVMKEGEIVQYGRPEQIYQRPATAWLAGFVGDAVVCDGTWRYGIVSSALGNLAAEWLGPQGFSAPIEGAIVTVMVRPEEVKLLDVEAAGLDALVTAVNFTGHDATVALRLDNGFSLRSRVTASEVPALGQRVGVRVRGRVLAYPRADTEPAASGAKEPR